jgi:integrase
MKPIKDKETGQYMVFWTCVDGYCDLHTQPTRHKAKLGTGDKETAKNRCRDLEKRLDEERSRNKLGLPKPNRSSLTLSNYWTLYREGTCFDKAETTKETEQYHFNSLLKFAGNVPLRELDQGLLENYKTTRLRTIAPRSWNSELGTLKSIFSWGLTRRPPMFDRNPFDDVSRVDKGEPTVEKYVSPEQIAQALSKSEPFWQNVMGFLAATWCRGRELRQLKWEDVNWSLGYLEFRQPKERKVKKLPLVPAIRRVLTQQRGLGLKSEYVFPGGDGGMMSKDQLHHALQLRGDRVGVKLSPHMFRHSGITNALDKGVNLTWVQQVAGHSQITTTQGYNHTDMSVKEKALELSSEILDAATKSLPAPGN